MYYFTYPFKKMYITQNYNQGNHKEHWYHSTNYKDYPIDESCGDIKKDPVYAPVDMKVIRIYGLNTTATTNAIVLQTTDKVRTPIGDRVVIMTLTHPLDSDINKLKVGQIIKKGAVICYEGNDGAKGNHIHLTVGTGSYKGLFKNNNGKYCFVETTTNTPEELIFVNTKFTKIINADGINWKTVTTDVVPNSGFLPPRGYFQKGDSGKNVEKIDSWFAKQVSGSYYGDYTVAVVKEFQQQNGLEQDGCIGPITLAKMKEKGFKE